jgi:GNAT superfamily N-acetyltransferase
MSALTFRPAIKADLPVLVSMLADDPLGALREDLSAPLNAAYLKAFAEIESDPNNELILAEREDQLVGMLQLTFIPYLTHTGSWRCLIEGVRIGRAHRGLGLGSQLIERAIERARTRGCRIIQLTADKQRADAIRFYQSLGFEATHEGFKRQL